MGIATLAPGATNRQARTRLLFTDCTKWTCAIVRRYGLLSIASHFWWSTRPVATIEAIPNFLLPPYTPRCLLLHHLEQLLSLVLLQVVLRFKHRQRRIDAPFIDATEAYNACDMRYSGDCTVAQLHRT